MSTVTTQLQQPDLSQLKRQWGVRSPGELRQRTREIGGRQYVIQGLIPERSISLLAGDSGLGKSPLLYQAAICVAAGVPFLGHPAEQGSVLYLDYENGVGEVNDLIERLAAYQGLADVPDNLLLWNYNDAPAKWGQPGYTFRDMILAIHPKLVIVDSLGAHCPDMEEMNSTATRMYQSFRKIISDCGCSFVGVHHLKKPSDKPDHAPQALENANLRQWFQQVRGARALVNGSDVRIGVDEPGVAGGLHNIDGNNEQIALVMRGFGRVRGEIPTTYIARVFDEEGIAQGYKKLTGASLLFNNGQINTYNSLPTRFRFKDAQLAYGKAAQPTTDFLNKCCSLGILRKVARGVYEKVQLSELHHEAPDSRSNRNTLTTAVPTLSCCSTDERNPPEKAE